VSRAIGCLLILLCLCEPTLLHAQEGKLQRVREDASRESTPSTSNSGGSDRGSSWDSSDDASGELFFYAAACCVAAPYVLPAMLVGDDYSERGYFPRYPYADGQPGSLQIRFLEDKPDRHEDNCPRWWMGRLALDGSSDFHGLDRLTGHLLLDTCFRLGVQSSWSYLTENLKGDKHDDMVLGDINLVFRFAQREFVQMRSGLGVRFSTDSSESHAGFNFTYGADLCPMQPLIFSALIDAGTLGSAGVFHGRITAGMIWRNWEVYAGYDYLGIGSVNLQGPVAGLRFWF
jgi:hypothetical protein